MLSFNYLVPALYFNATAQTAVSLGSLSTGGGLIHAHAMTGTLRSEPGFEPSFVATFLYGEDYPTVDASGSIARSNLRGVVVPDDGDTPFQMHATSIQIPNDEFNVITASNTSSGLAVPYGATYSVWIPTFHGGSAKYANLQNSVFVASETVSDGPNPGEFYVDTGGKLTGLLTIHGFIHDVETWLESPPIYHLEVKSTPEPCNEPFYMSNSHVEKARKYTVSWGSDRIPTDVYVVLRVQNLDKETAPGFAAYVDPWAMYMNWELSLMAQDNFMVTPNGPLEIIIPRWKSLVVTAGLVEGQELAR